MGREAFMNTLLIPCLGRRLVNGIPQYVGRHPNGKLLIERCIEGINCSLYSRILIAILKEDEERYQAGSIILSELTGYPVELIYLDEMTSGPAETVYKVLKIADVTGSVVIKDADNYLKMGEQPCGNFIAGLDLNTWNRDIHNLRNKSFLIVNEQKNILDIIEKQVRSDVICLGLYGFQRSKDFITAYEHLNDPSYPITKLYVSHVISYLIGYSGRVFHYVPCTEYENWGDERLWREMQEDYSLYFLDLDHLFDKSEFVSEEEICRNIRLLQDRGASFIGYSVKGRDQDIGALQVFSSKDIRLTGVVRNCPWSENALVIHSGMELNNFYHKGFE